VIAEGRVLLHAALDDVAARLRVAIESHPPADAMYYEQTLQGYRVVRLVPEGSDADVDLELLFNLATARGVNLHEAFAARTHAGVRP
jgi:hypothetical protein